jgi:hypothetical protein
MSDDIKTSRCAFVILKFRINDEDVFLMRRDADWNDVNFIGGHELPQDRGKLKNAARRELLEEVPALRRFNRFHLTPLTSEFSYGPVFSHSAKCNVKYQLRFFLLEFTEDPKPLFETLAGRTQNILVSERNFSSAEYRPSALMEELERVLGGNIQEVPYSWPKDLSRSLSNSKFLPRVQHVLPIT